jgi:cell division protein FtsB
MSESTDQVSRAEAAAVAAAARSTRLTGRAALLAVVICAIALSLAYPVREYIAQRQQIDQLLAQQQTLAAQVQALQQQNTKLGQTWYIEQQARAQLHMCFPSEQCYEVISGQPPHSAASRKQPPGEPWYDKLWQSVKRADAQPAGAKRPGR